MENKINQQLYFVEVTPTNSQSSDCERNIYVKISSQFHHKIVTENVKKMILAEIQDIHDEFFVKYPRMRKDKNFEFKEVTWERGGHLDEYTSVNLGESGVSSIRFYPKSIIDWDIDRRCYFVIKAKEE